MNSFFPLTLTQRDIFFDQMYYIDSPLYNIGGYIKCKGINIERMKAAHKKLALSHDVFGIRIVQKAGEVYQYVSKEVDYDMQIFDISHYPDSEKKAIEYLDELFQKKIEFIDKQLCFGYLLKLNTNDFWYVGLSHHLAMDGWGFAKWSYKLAEYYNDQDQALKRITPEELSYEAISQGDQKYLQSKRYNSDKTFWASLFQQPVDKLLSPHYSYLYKDSRYIPSTRYRHYLSRDLFSACSFASASIGVGVPHFMLGILAFYFASACDKKSMVFGIPAHNRNNHAQKNKVGVFTSVSPLGIDIAKNSTFKSLLNDIAKRQKANFRHQKFPFGDLISLLDRHSHERTLYDVSFNYLKLEYGNLKFGDDNVSVIYHPSGYYTTPLTVTLWDGDEDEIELQLDFNHAYFTFEEISQLANRFQYFAQFFSQPKNFERPLLDIPIVDREISRSLIAKISSEDSSLPQASCVHSLFEQQAQVQPDAIAVRYSEQTLSYQQLDEQANQLAHYLQAQGIGRGECVGVCLERSLDMVVSLLAILKAGGCYIPLDPSYPAARLAHIFEDTQLRFLLSDSSLVAVLPQMQGLCITLDTLVLDSYPVTPVALTFTPDAAQLAYMIFTSGSTGKPKGVMISHGAFANFLAAMQIRLSGVLAWQNKCLAVTTIAFDIAGLELFGPLSYGGEVVLASHADSQDPQRLATLIDAQGITLLQATPATWDMLVNDGWSGAPELVALIGGEALPLGLAKQLCARTKQLWNCYGPTEATVWSLVQAVDETQLSTGKIVLGGALGNYSHYVLNQQGQVQPIGCVGELHIGGVGLATGYLNLPQVTAERFIDNPFYDANNPASSERLYKTGDLVRYLADGQLEFLGRIDDQVKIRGFRIELGEIEAQLVAQPEVESALVVAKEVAGSQQLVGYVRAHNELEGDETQGEWLAERKAQLQAVLPQYMVPAALVLISQWPLTPNGKIDKKALPSPDSVVCVGHYEAPTGEVEWGVAQLWAELLGRAVDEISAHGNFFDLGGHSLLTTRLVAGVRSRFAVELSVQQVFEQRTLRSLAEVIGQAQGGAMLPALCAQPRAGNQAPLSYSQQRLWFIDQLQGAT
ncbi:hypothetical protein LCGC14_1586780, partial [marine sediment metagenome]